MSDSNGSPDDIPGDVYHEDCDRPAAESQDPKTPSAHGENGTNREGLKAELEPEYAGANPPMYVRPLAPADPQNTPSSEKSDDASGENYSHEELRKLYHIAKKTAITQKVEIDALNRVIEDQDAVAAGKLQQAGDDFNDQLAAANRKFNDRERNLIAEHRKGLDSAKKDANDRIALKESERKDAERQATEARADQKKTYRQWAYTSAFLVLLAIALGVTVGRDRDDLQHAQDMIAELQSNLSQAQTKILSLPHLAGSEPAVASTLPKGDRPSEQDPSMAQRNQEAARMLYKMHVRLPDLYEKMPEFQEYSQALVEFNDALAPVPLAHRVSVISAAHSDEKALNRSQVCEADFVESSGLNRALYINPDSHEDTRTDLKAEAGRLRACVEALRHRVSYEWSHPEVNWDKVRAEQEAAKDAATQVAP